MISPRHWSGKLVIYLTKLCEDKPGGSSQVPDSSCVRNEAVRRDKGQAAKVLRRTMGDLFVTNLMWAAASHRHTVTRSRDTQHIASHRDTGMLALQFTHLVGRYNTNRCTVTVVHNCNIPNWRTISIYLYNMMCNWCCCCGCYSPCCCLCKEGWPTMYPSLVHRQGKEGFYSWGLNRPK